MAAQTKAKNESKQLDESTKSKTILWIISALIAVFLWTVINYTEDPVIDVTLNKIKLEYRGITELENRGLTVTPSSRTQNVSISVHGTRSDLIQLLRRGKAYVDLSQITEADTYTVDIQYDMPSSSVQIKNQKIKSVDVVVEPVVTKDIPVVVHQMDKSKDYYVRSVPEQQYITVSAAGSLMDEVSEVMTAVSVIDMTEDNVQQYSYRILTNDGSEIDHKEEFKTDTQSITIYNELYKITPMEVKVEVPQSVAAAYSVSIVQTPTVNVGVREGAPEKVTAVFPENAVTSTGIGDYTASLQEDEGIYTDGDVTSVKIRANITKKELQYVKIPVKVINVPDDKRVHSSTPSIDTYVNCVPSKLSSASLTAYADADGLSEGEHEVALTFSDVDDVTVIGTYKVRLTVEDK